MFDLIVETLRAVELDGIWRPLAILGSVGYALILAIVIRKAVRENNSETPARASPAFYLAQAYLAFMWPLPLFLAFEAMDLLNIWTS